MKNGETDLPIPSATLNMNCVNSGVTLARINNGTTKGAIKLHFVDASGIKKPIIITKTKNTIINSAPENCKELTKFISNADINVPKLVHFNTLIIIEAKNINTKTYPTLSKLLYKPTL